MLAIQGRAAPVDESTARTIIKEFVVAKRGMNINSTPTSNGSNLKLLHAEMSNVNMTQYAYYIYNTGDGFVIVSGDDRAEQILGYGDEDLDMNNIPCGMQLMLDSYKEQIDYLLDNPELVVETPSMNAPRLSVSDVSPMLTAKWHQYVPFYNLTPVSDGKHCKTGCCCVALSQVMYFWEHPKTAVPSVPAYTTRTLHLQLPTLASTSFDWSNMIDSYDNGYTSTQANAVAKLMRYVGQAEEMDYTPSASGAYVSNIRDAAIMFGYDHNTKVLYKDYDNYNNAEWAAMILAELYARRPIVYAASSTTTPIAHAFNIDGYRASDNKFHIVWGWKGSPDGYFALNAFNVQGHQFNASQEMIVGLKPQAPEITVDPASLSFSAFTGETKTATFTVKAYAITGNLTVTLNNGGSVFYIDKTSITKSEACSGVKVTVTYKPTKACTSNASITISGGNATSKTVNLSGNATNKITVTPSGCSWKNVYVGQTRTQKFKVTVPRADGDLSVTLNPNDGIYSIDKTSIPMSDAINSATVTVSYHPIEEGTSNATITFSGGGVSPKTVTLSGTAIKPEISTDHAVLSFFNTYINAIATKKFIVKGTNLLSGLTLTLNDESGNFTIDKTFISMDKAASGDTVTVTFNPIEDGTKTAFITINGGGYQDAVDADTKKISLRGTTATAITVNPEEVSFNAFVGETKTESLFVQAPKATGALLVSLDNRSSKCYYSINKGLIPVNEAIEGTTVTVTYHPTIIGNNHQVNMVITGGGTETKIVPITGNAVADITIDPEYLSFSTYTGKPMSKTLTLSGTILSDLTLTLNDSSGSYSIDKTNITLEEAANGVTVTVTYSPASDGSHSASVLIGCGSAEPKTVSLDGSAVTPEIITDVSSVTIDPTYTGYEGSQTILITATNLLSDLHLSLSNDFTNSFILTKHTITPEDAAAGVPVTVCFYPTTGGGKHAILNIKCDGIETVHIPVNGTGIKSDGYIAAWPTNLSFETQAGTPVTRTFKVTYTYPNGSVMINRVNADDETSANLDCGIENAMLTLNTVNIDSSNSRAIIPFDGVSRHFKDLDEHFIIEPIVPVLFKTLVLELTGDNCFSITPARIRLENVPNSTFITVTYLPDNVGEDEAYIKIKLLGGAAKPFIVSLHGTAMDQLQALNCDNEGNDLIILQNLTSINPVVEELSMSSKVYAEGLSIIIESPVEQKAVISDIAGHTMEVNLQAGRNEIPINANGVYLVRIREKSTKLMLK